jgi:hypothetical protein
MRINLFYVTLRAEIATMFGPNVVAISARNTKVYKICELCKPYFPHFTTFSDQTLQIYSFQYALSSCGDLFASPCIVLKLVYTGNCLFFDRLRVFHFMRP